MSVLYKTWMETPVQTKINNTVTSSHDYKNAMYLIGLAQFVLNTLSYHSMSEDYPRKFCEQ